MQNIILLVIIGVVLLLLLAWNMVRNKNRGDDSEDTQSEGDAPEVDEESGLHVRKSDVSQGDSKPQVHNARSSSKAQGIQDRKLRKSRSDKYGGRSAKKDNAYGDMVHGYDKRISSSRIEADYYAEPVKARFPVGDMESEFENSEDEIVHDGQRKEVRFGKEDTKSTRHEKYKKGSAPTFFPTANAPTVLLATVIPPPAAPRHSDGSDFKKTLIVLADDQQYNKGLYLVFLCNISPTMNGDYPLVFPPPEASTMPPPAEEGPENTNLVVLGGAMAALVFFLCCIVYYIYHYRKKNRDDHSMVNGREQDLEKGNARKVEAVRDKEVKMAKNVKRSEQNYARFKRGRDVLDPDRIRALDGDVESGFDETCESSDPEFYSVKKPKSEMSFGRNAESDSETEYDRRFREVKAAKDAAKRVGALGGSHRVAKSRNESNPNGKAKRSGRSAGA
ncbi:hypothetical protein ACET3Z_033088 [Daucus carota]